MTQAGLYAIQHLPSGRRYIGSSVDIGRRWMGHTSHLQRGTHHCAELQAAWDRDGRSAFAFVVLEEVNDFQARRHRERLLIRASGNLFNTSTDALTGPKPGFKHRPESIAKMGANRGRAMSAEQKAKLSAWRTGRKFPAHSAAMKGRKMPAETRAKISATQMGRVFSEETRLKLSNAHKGRVFSPEHKANISAAKRGKTRTPEHRAKISAGVKATNLRKLSERQARRADDVALAAITFSPSDESAVKH